MIPRAAQAYVEQLIATLQKLPYDKIERFVKILNEARRRGSKVIIFGNGGSAATASHMACDLGKGTANEGQPRLRALSLTDNISLLTAAGNDLGYEEIFVEQLRILLEPGDVVIGISASGNSENVVRALDYAGQRGAIRVGLIGFDGGRVKERVEECIWIDNHNYGQVEDVHLVIEHIITSILCDRSILD